MDDKIRRLFGLDPSTPDSYEYAYNKEDPYFKDYRVEELDIADLVKDNDLLNDAALGSYHQEMWENKSPDQFRFDPNRLDKNNPIRATRQLNGKLRLADGKHRTRALYNSGYKKLRIPVYTEKE